MYNSWYNIEQTIARKRSRSQVCLLLGHKLASRRVNLGEVLADDEESSELSTTDSGIEYECSDKCLLNRLSVVSDVGSFIITEFCPNNQGQTLGLD